MAQGGRDGSDDPFASTVKFWQPTASQHARFPCLPFLRDSEEFQDSHPHLAHGSHDSAGNQPEDTALFLTPPARHLSSSEDQNPCAACVRRVADPKKTRVPVVEVIEVIDEINDWGHRDATDVAPIVEAIDANHEPVRNITVDKGKNKMAASENWDDEEVTYLFTRRTACRRIEDIDTFQFTGCDTAAAKSVPCKRKRQLPVPMKEKGKEKKNDEGTIGDGKEKLAANAEGNYDFLGILKSILKEINDKKKGNDDGREDIREIAKMCGMTFPRPRWRGEEEK